MMDVLTVVGFVMRVYGLAVVVPGSVTSWGRSLKRNAAVGGDPFSGHLFWLGVDYVADDPRQLERARTYCRLVGLVLVVEKDHWHLEPAAWTPRQVTRGASGSPGRP